MALTKEQMTAYVNQHVEPDLAHIYDASEVEVAYQYELVRQGCRILRRVACIGGNVDEARRELREELNLTTTQAADPAKYKDERLALAMLADAWRVAQCHFDKDNQTKAEAKAMQLPTPVAPLTRVAMRRAIEALPSVGKIPDREAPGPQYLSQKMEEVEQHVPAASPLDEVVSLEDNDDYQL